MGRPTSGFASCRPPLMSNVRRHRMPFYRFRMMVAIPPPVALQRIRSLARRSPGWSESARTAAPRQWVVVPRFFGRIGRHSFALRRSEEPEAFVPLVLGSTHPHSSGSEVRVTIILQPFTSIFMFTWLSLVAPTAWRGLLEFQAESIGTSLIPVGMFIIGVSLTLGAFILEAARAKRALVEALTPAHGA